MIAQKVEKENSPHRHDGDTGVPIENKNKGLNVTDREICFGATVAQITSTVTCPLNTFPGTVARRFKNLKQRGTLPQTSLNG